MKTKAKRNEQDMQYLENTLMGREMIGKTDGTVTVRPLGHNEAVTTSADIMTEGVELTRELTIIDKVVADAIYTLHEQHKDVFSLNQICEILTGGNWSTPGMREIVQNSIKKMMLTRVRIDCTAEICKRENKPTAGRKVVYEGYLLPLETVYETFGNRESVTYRMMKTPPLLEYAKRIRQVIAYDPALLQIGEKNNTADILAIRYILLSKIMMLSNGKGRAKSTLTMDELQKLLNMNPKDRRKRMKIADAVETILQAYCETPNTPVYGWDVITGPRGSWQGVSIGVMPRTVANQTMMEAEPEQMRQDKDDDILTFWETDEMLDWWATQGMAKIARGHTKQMRS